MSTGWVQFLISIVHKLSSRYEKNSRQSCDSNPGQPPLFATCWLLIDKCCEKLLVLTQVLVFFIGLRPSQTNQKYPESGSASVLSRLARVPETRDGTPRSTFSDFLSSRSSKRGGSRFWGSTRHPSKEFPRSVRDISRSTSLKMTDRIQGEELKSRSRIPLQWDQMRQFCPIWVIFVAPWVLFYWFICFSALFGQNSYIVVVIFWKSLFSIMRFFTPINWSCWFLGSWSKTLLALLEGVKHPNLIKNN